MPARSPSVADRQGTVLVAEDSATVRSLVSDILQRAGFDVFVCKDGEEALQRAAACEDELDLLLSDVVMPDMKGRELYHRLVAEAPDLEVIYMSGYSPDPIAEDGTTGGKTRYLQKPFIPDELLAAVVKALGPA